MEMSHDEICMRYRTAKKKTEQIKILAELNAVGEKVIRDILKEGGYLTPGSKKKTAKTDKTLPEGSGVLREQEAREEIKRLKKPAQINKDFDDEINKMMKEAETKANKGAEKEMVKKRTEAAVQAEEVKGAAEQTDGATEAVGQAQTERAREAAVPKRKIPEYVQKLVAQRQAILSDMIAAYSKELAELNEFMKG